MNLDVPNSSFKTCRKDNITDELLRDLIAHNLDVLDRILDYNIMNNNKMYRLSSSLIPFGSSPLNTLKWEEEFQEEFYALKQKIINNNIRVTIHPGQYTVINSPNLDVVRRSFDDLMYHAKLLNLLSGSRNSKMILHIGGIYNDKEAALDRFVENYNSLPKEVLKYLIIENDDRLFTIEDALYISSKTGVPVVYDNLHHKINPSFPNLTEHEILEKVIKTWQPQDGVPKMHYSQQAPFKRTGAHSDTIYAEAFLKDFETYHYFLIDIMLEVKDKNRSFIKVNSLLYPTMKSLEKEWAHYKYLIMMHSQKHYNLGRNLFSNNQIVDPLEFYIMVEEALSITPTIGSQTNAFNHLWSYFKRIATPREQDQYIALLESFRKGETESKKCLQFFKKLALKYNIRYLIESYIFE